MSSEGLAGLARQIQRIVGIAIPDDRLGELLALTPLSPRSLNRFFQRRAKVQLKKGQSDHIVKALGGARGSEANAPHHAPSPSAVVDTDLSALSTGPGRELARVLRSVLHDVHFDQVNRDLRLPRYGGDYEIRPFPLPGSPVDTHEMKVRLRDAVKASRGSVDDLLARRIRQAFAFFFFGEALHQHELAELFGAERTASLDEGLRLGLFIKVSGQTIRMNGLLLLLRRLRNGAVIHAFADTPPHFATRTAQQRVYAGADSYELLERVSEMAELSGYCVEMGSGSGIQLIAALKQHRGIIRAIGNERDRRALQVSLFNAALNEVDDRMAVVDNDDDLPRALEGHSISLAITNPPFIAMPAWIDVDPEDRTALAGVMDIRETAHGFQGDLRTVFPPAGWGGEDGLEVTKHFVDVVVPLLAREGQMVIYSQFAGNPDGPTAFQDYAPPGGDIRVAFESVKSRTLAVKQMETGLVAEGQTRQRLSAGETATSV